MGRCLRFRNGFLTLVISKSGFLFQLRMVLLGLFGGHKEGYLPAPLVTADLAPTTVTQSAVESAPADEGPPMAEVGHGSGDEPQLEPVPGPDFKQRFLDFVGVLDLLWLGISFAILIVGFVVGAVWLRERNRRRLGGMYLRI